MSTKFRNTVASFAKEVNARLTKHPLVFRGCLANRWLIFLVKEATVNSLYHNQAWKLFYLDLDIDTFTDICKLYVLCH